MTRFKLVVSVGLCFLLLGAGWVGAAAKPASIPWPPQPVKPRVAIPAPAAPLVASGYKLTPLYSGLGEPWGLGVDKYGRYAVVNDFLSEQALLISTGNPGHIFDALPLAGAFAAKMWDRCYLSDNTGNLYVIWNGSLAWIWSYGGSDYAISAIGIDHSNGMVYFMLSYVGDAEIYQTYLYRFDPNTSVAEMIMGFEDLSLGVAVKGNYVYVSTMMEGKIWRVNKKITSGPPEPFMEGLSGPAGMDFDSGGNLWLAEIAYGPLGTIGKIPAGTRKRTAIARGFDTPVGIGVDLRGRIVFTEFRTGNVWVLRKK